jgi:hypothetical protein
MKEGLVGPLSGVMEKTTYDQVIGTSFQIANQYEFKSNLGPAHINIKSISTHQY